MLSLILPRIQHIQHIQPFLSPLILIVIGITENDGLDFRARDSTIIMASTRREFLPIFDCSFRLPVQHRSRQAFPPFSSTGQITFLVFRIANVFGSGTLWVLQG